ncbi:MAG: hypothetical protein V2I33_22510 [Kangiellaceae bacterium]|jgi:serine/threonine protein kinase|nr:hypothetical protein [Kangiellaceae bacterium]
MDNEYDTGDAQEKFSDYYQFIKRLGAGSFGQVVQALDKRTSEHVAVKIISKVSVKPNKLSKLR